MRRYFVAYEIVSTWPMDEYALLKGVGNVLGKKL
jgi:hypothetical protein